MEPISIIIVAAFCLIAGFVDAVAGGGGLVSLPGYYLAGFQAHAAIGTNKINSLLASATAMVSYARFGYIPFKLAILCAIGGLFGSAAGATIALSIPANAFTVIMIVLIPLTAIYLLTSRTFNKDAGESSTSRAQENGDLGESTDSATTYQENGVVPSSVQPPFSRQIPRSMAARAFLASVVIGAYDGFYGPGSGTYLLVAFIGFAHLSSEVANGVSKVVICATNLAGMVVFFFGGQSLVLVGLIAGAASMVGSAIGARAFSRGGMGLAKPLILIVLAIFFVRVIWDLIATM